MPFGPMGHVYDWRAVQAYCAESRDPLFGVSGAMLQESGKGKIVLLHKAVISAIGRFPIHNQTIGDCVSHGFGLAVDVLKCVEIVVSGEDEEFVSETATEAIYAYSRVEIGGGRLGSGDGSVGAWAAKAVQFGTLLRQKYPSVDLTAYSGALAKSWGMPRAGLPDALEGIARLHPVRTSSLVTSYEQVRDAIANGYPVAICSQQGFGDRRDEKGFARPSGTWSHCMAVTGIDDSDSRPGALVNNSWGPDWIGGPKRHDQPDGSFWADAEVIDRMVSRDPDSHVISGYDGYPKQNPFESA